MPQTIACCDATDADDIHASVDNDILLRDAPPLIESVPSEDKLLSLPIVAESFDASCPDIDLFTMSAADFEGCALDEPLLSRPASGSSVARHLDGSDILIDVCPVKRAEDSVPILSPPSAEGCTDVGQVFDISGQLIDPVKSTVFDVIGQLGEVIIEGEGANSTAYDLLDSSVDCDITDCLQPGVVGAEENIRVAEPVECVVNDGGVDDHLGNSDIDYVVDNDVVLEEDQVPPDRLLNYDDLADATTATILDENRVGADNDQSIPLVLASIANSIHATIGESTIPILIDTGASTSLVSRQVYLDHPLLHSQPIRPGLHQLAKSANGSDIQLLGRITLPLIIGECKISHDVYVADPLTSGIILGIDCLQAYKMLLNFDDNTLTIPGADPVKLLDRANLIGNYRIAVNETVVLDPRAQTVIQAQVFGNPPEGHEGVIEPVKNLLSRHNVIGGRVLTKPVDGIVPYLLLNPGNEPVKLYKGSTLGFMTKSPVEVIFSLDNDSDAVEQVMTCDPTEPVTTTPINKLKVDPPDIDLTDSDLTEQEKEKLSNLLGNYRDVFANTSDELGRSSVTKMHIDTGDHPPIRQVPNRTGPVQKAIIEHHIDQMLKQDIIRPSYSPWSSPVVLVKKKDFYAQQTGNPNLNPDNYRYAIDYRKINAVTCKDSYAIPRIDDSIDCLSHC
jgi:hypothetical protein